MGSGLAFSDLPSNLDSSAGTRSRSRVHRDSHRRGGGVLAFDDVPSGIESSVVSSANRNRARHRSSDGGMFDDLHSNYSSSGVGSGNRSYTRRSGALNPDDVPSDLNSSSIPSGRIRSGRGRGHSLGIDDVPSDLGSSSLGTRSQNFPVSRRGRAGFDHGSGSGLAYDDVPSHLSSDWNRSQRGTSPGDVVLSFGAEPRDYGRVRDDSEFQRNGGGQTSQRSGLRRAAKGGGKSEKGELILASRVALGM